MGGRGKRGGALALWLLAESGLFLLLAHQAESAAAHVALSSPAGIARGGYSIQRAHPPHNSPAHLNPHTRALLSTREIAEKGGRGGSDPRTWAEGEGETVGRVGEMEAELEGGKPGVAGGAGVGAAVGGERGAGGIVTGGEVRGGEGEGKDGTTEIRQDWGQVISFKQKSDHLKALKAQGRCNAHPKLFRTWLWESAFQEGSLAWVPQPGKHILMDCQRSQVSNRIGCMRRHLLLAGLLNRTLVVPLRPSEVTRFYDRRAFLHLPHLQGCYGPRSVISLDQLRQEVRMKANEGGLRAALGRAKGEAGRGENEESGEGEEEDESEGEGKVMVQQVACPYEACYMQPWANKPSVLPDLEGVVYHNMTWTALNMPLSHLFTLSDLRTLGSVILPSADVVLFGDSYQWNLHGNLSKSVGLPFRPSASGLEGSTCANKLAVQPHPAILEAALGFVQHVIWTPSGSSASSSPSPTASLPGVPAAAAEADAASIIFTAAVAAAGAAGKETGSKQQGTTTSRMSVMGSAGEPQLQPQRYLAVHWRRGDLLMLYQEILALLTAETSGRCIGERTLRSGNISTVFLATDADEKEVGELQRAIRHHVPGVKIVQLPEVLKGEVWAEVLEPFRFQNQPLLRATLDKAVCAFADVFMGTPRSSFSTDIERLRTGLKISTCEDEYICESMLS
ncbi:hypothetical protein CLOM_g11848 [Closterium sp. NIES-68]|nr:hypothetical protein CLOM_g11848 [Closterium sp. NIES-68]GJP67875.1 hypothetical protein CLOP_g24636 [Closterium sp. NIES-67]